MNEAPGNAHHSSSFHTFNPSATSQIPHTPKAAPCQTEDPIDQYLHHQAHEIVFHPYAIEEPVEEPPSPATSVTDFSDTEDTGGETSQGELVDSMEGLQCDSDNFPHVTIKPTRGKKRKPGSSSSSLPHGQFQMESDGDYSPSSLSPKRRCRRIKWPSKNRRAAQAASVRSSQSTDSGYSTPRSSTTDTSDEVTDDSAAPEAMEID